MPEGAFALGSLSERQPPALPVGKAEHKPYQKKPPKEQPFQLLVDIQAKMAEGKGEGYKKWTTKFNLNEMSKTLLFLQEQKIGSAEELRERAAAATERYHAGEGYKKWTTKFNLNEMSKTLLFLQEQKIGSAEELRERAAAATERYHAMGDSIKAAEARLTEIAVLKNHIINYAKTREVYAAYRKAGYSKKFLDAHREEITLHKAAKTAFDEAGLQKLPKVKELDAEFAELLTKKKEKFLDAHREEITLHKAAKTAFDEAGLQKLPKVKELDAEFAELLTKKKVAYPDYRKAREEMQPLLRAQKNVELFFAEEKNRPKAAPSR